MNQRIFSDLVSTWAVSSREFLIKRSRPDCYSSVENRWSHRSMSDRTRPVTLVHGEPMRCSKCGTDNAAGSRFCNQCATSLNKLCPKCSSDNAPEAKFCAQCAAPLDSIVTVRRGTEPREGPTGERRHLTVLFCDL